MIKGGEKNEDDVSAKEEAQKKSTWFQEENADIKWQEGVVK